MLIIIEDVESDECISELVSMIGVVTRSSCLNTNRLSLIATSAQPKNCSLIQTIMKIFSIKKIYSIYVYTLNNTATNATDISNIITTPAIARHPFPLKHAMIACQITRQL